jgi:heme exporter protein A
VQIIAEHLAIVRGARTIIEDLSFVAASGESVLLTGDNGAGKTTLLRALAGFLRI